MKSPQANAWDLQGNEAELPAVLGIPEGYRFFAVDTKRFWVLCIDPVTHVHSWVPADSGAGSSVAAGEVAIGTGVGLTGFPELTYDHPLATLHVENIATPDAAATVTAHLLTVHGGAGGAASGATAGGDGAEVDVIGGAGGAAAAGAGAAGNGGAGVVAGGLGGDGTATGQAGSGGNVTVAGGNAGANGQGVGAGGNLGGAAVVAGGNGTGDFGGGSATLAGGVGGSGASDGPGDGGPAVVGGGNGGTSPDGGGDGGSATVEGGNGGDTTGGAAAGRGGSGILAGGTGGGGDGAHAAGHGGDVNVIAGNAGTNGGGGGANGGGVTIDAGSGTGAGIAGAVDIGASASTNNIGNPLKQTLRRGGQRSLWTVPPAYPYTATTADEYILVDCAAAHTIHLDSNLADGTEIEIVATGTGASGAGLNPVTIDTVNGGTVVGPPGSGTINVDQDKRRYKHDTTNNVWREI